MNSYLLMIKYRYANCNKRVVFVMSIICRFVICIFYNFIFTFVYHDNFWNIYNSYHLDPKTWKKKIWNKYMEMHGASISIDAQIEAPLILPHGVSGIYVTQSAKIGKNVVIFQQVTIGANTILSSKSYGAPLIGNNVYVGAGAKIIGNANIGDNCRIGANAVVVENIPSNSIVVLDKPRIIVRSEPLDNSFIPYLK